MQTGEVLIFRQYAASGACGGINVQFSNGAQFGYGVNDQTGTSAINDCTGSGWHTRRIALDVGANATISNWWIDFNEGSSGSGPWDLYVSDVAIVKQNGSVVPLFTKGSGVGLTSVHSNDLNYSNITNLSIGAGEPNVTIQQRATNATTYYHADHLGTAQMEFAGSGWPVWTGDFAPYGQEINPQQTANNYKFTGLERDAEGNLNLDHAQFRQYSSQTGRWMSPDSYDGSMDLSNPQSLNRYSYVGNMPLSFIDPSGLDGCSSANEAASAAMGIACIVGGGGSGFNGGFLGFLADVASLAIDFLGFGHPQIKGTTTPRPNGAPSNPPCSVSASSVDNYLGTKNSPMVGQGTNFLASGQKHNLDPRLLVSLAGAEKGFGSNITAGSFNALNVLYGKPKLNSPFSSFQSNINAAAKSLTNPANGYNLSNTATLYSTYCSGNCKVGLGNVNKFMGEQGANVNALHNPCKKE